ncbi:MAG TPA: glycosyltransferase family 2 protein [Rhodanobacteraceae bacterium]|nr:glycosyltransferase family 2 protein [Rhodanobacteraceae bacterium]
MPSVSAAAALTSIVVVVADSGGDALACVEAALASAAAVELIVVDNASRDGVPEALACACAGDARVRLLRNGANLGFGAAVNRGAALAQGDVLLVLNPDCRLERDSVARLRAELAAQPRAGLIGAVVCDIDGRPDRNAFRRDPLLARALATFRARALGRGDAAAAGGVHGEGPMPTASVAVEAVSGALMLLPKAVFDAVGGFDEGYFLHCEDLDLCRRVRDAGYAVLLAGGVRVLHARGGSSRRRPLFVSWHKHRGMWRWFRRFDPAARHPLLMPVVWIGLWTHFALTAPRLAWSGWRARRGSRAALSDSG